ncbi:hypothetical protein ACHAPU_009128 [Fusarium lateritium]
MISTKSVSVQHETAANLQTAATNASAARKVSTEPAIRNEVVKLSASTNRKMLNPNDAPETKVKNHFPTEQEIMAALAYSDAIYDKMSKEELWNMFPEFRDYKQPNGADASLDEILEWMKARQEKKQSNEQEEKNSQLE